MYTIKNAIKIEGGHLACLIFLPDKLSGDSDSVSQIRAMVIACHGFRGGKENGGRIQSLAAKLTASNFGLLAFDFRGTGESSGNFAEMTISSQAADLQQVINWVESAYKVPMVVLGRSLGGSTVIASMASDLRPVAAVLWSTPVMVRQTFSEMLGQLVDELVAGKTVTISYNNDTYQLGPGFWQDLQQHDFINYLNLFRAKPLLVIHGEEDEVVKLDNAMVIKETVPAAQLITVPGADHKFINGWELREDFTVAWLNRIFS